MSETTWLPQDQTYAQDEDAKLVLAAQHNPAEFKQIYQKWLKRIYRYFYFRVGSEHDAEDLTSQVFLRAYEDLPRYRDRGCFSAWLFTIAKARAADFYRKRHNEVALEEIEHTSSSWDLSVQTDRTIEIQQVLGLIRTLPDEEQELIRLRFVAELNYREIGLILNRNEEAVRKHTSRLLDRIQSTLENNHG